LVEFAIWDWEKRLGVSHLGVLRNNNRQSDGQQLGPILAGDSIGDLARPEL